ncbi:GNAT family N-acetyltransferase [Agreia bicolorata]|uniref:GNAT family N-acetyltransferase n=1 Tax=Agreia bicolorata TaxID=110935 RepID=UPI0005CA5CAB|nr:GNAT family N-acetyltransferase [Agreia bicolorata]
MSTSTHSLDFRTFQAAITGDTPDASTAGWLEAEFLGFHGRKPTPTHAASVARNIIDDGQVLTGVYDTDAPTHSLRPDIPVATFSSFEKPLTVSPGVQMPAHLISSVTVRATHRRRGILRRMMTDDLDRAAEAGLAVAALTASEASIYRRFGFGAATWVHDLAVDTDSRFALTTTPGGYCSLVDPHDIPAIAPAVFDAFHVAQPGSIARHAQYADRISGRVTEEGEEDRARRAAVHYSDAGDVDGYVTYRFSGWESKPHSIEVTDLVAASRDAYLALWQYLASIDLSTRVTFSSGAPDDALRWALVDPRVLTVTNIEDRIWLRILDPIAAFTARTYGDEGSVSFRVTDSLGFAAGSFRLSTEAGAGQLERLTSGSVDIEMDAWVLGALYLGGADARVAAAAGALREVTPGAATTMQRLLAPAVPVYSNTSF